MHDKDLKARIPVKAGPHNLAVTFVKEGSSLIETPRQPTESRFNDRRYPRTVPAIDQVSVTGPYAPKGAGGHAEPPPVVCMPARRTRQSGGRKVRGSDSIDADAARLSAADRSKPTLTSRWPSIAKGAPKRDFDAGIATALSAVLTNPEFLFRVESDPKKAPARRCLPNQRSRAGIATCRSFLWSSIPDDELLDAAIRGKLSQPGELEKQARRMLADRRSFNLATNFAGQWLRLRNIDCRHSKHQSFSGLRRQPAASLPAGNRALLRQRAARGSQRAALSSESDYTFLNERLAKHYGIPNVYGSRFRRVTLAPESKRGGLLRQGSVLSVTSYATRTSPVLRGVLVLRNILGAPPPSPPPNVPALDESTMAANLPMRQRLAAHRSNAVCASCHRTIDPVGFSLENFNAVGQWRDVDVEDQAGRCVGSVARRGRSSAASTDSKTRCCAVPNCLSQR